MSVVKRYNPSSDQNTWYMLAADTAPENAKDGDTLFVVDTPAEYVFLNGDWYDKTDGSVLGGGD
jgi:hypothetical protein